LMGVNGEPFIVGLPPSFEKVGAATVITYVCPLMTLKIMIDFEPESGAFPREIHLLKEAVTTSSGIEKGWVEFRDGRGCAIRQYREEETPEGVIDAIERVQQEWRRLASEEGMKIPQNGFFYCDESEEHKRFPIGERAIGGSGAKIGREALGHEGAEGDGPGEKVGKPVLTATGGGTGVEEFVEAVVAKLISVGSSGRKDLKKKNKTYPAKARQEIFEAWQKHNVAERFRFEDFYADQKDFCNQRGINSVPDLKRCLDSERKGRVNKAKREGTYKPKKGKRRKIAGK